MALGTHRHSPNGMHARDEQGRMVCWCGIPYEDHAAAMAEGFPVRPLPLSERLERLDRLEVRVAMLSSVVAADQMEAALSEWLESGTTGAREAAERARDAYRETRSPHA